MPTAAPDPSCFRPEVCHNCLPYLQLSACLAHIGELEHACWHNQQAARWALEDRTCSTTGSSSAAREWTSTPSRAILEIEAMTHLASEG
jgi:hypothetical protein